MAPSSREHIKLKSAAKARCSEKGLMLAGQVRKGLKWHEIFGVKQRPNPLENSSQLTVWWFKVVIEL